MSDSIDPNDTLKFIDQSDSFAHGVAFGILTAHCNNSGAPELQFAIPEAIEDQVTVFAMRTGWIETFSVIDNRPGWLLCVMTAPAQRCMCPSCRG